MRDQIFEEIKKALKFSKTTSVSLRYYEVLEDYTAVIRKNFGGNKNETNS